MASPSVARLDDFTGNHVAVDDDSAELAEC